MCTYACELRPEEGIGDPALSPPLSLETGCLIEPGAGLASNKPQLFYCLHPHSAGVRGYVTAPGFLGEYWELDE